MDGVGKMDSDIGHGTHGLAVLLRTGSISTD